MFCNLRPGAKFLMIVVLLATFAAGYMLGTSQRSNDANDLLSVGFRIYDPQGYEIASFDN
jgi:hypothetical protein